MKLLVTTQKVDKHDPILGFFHTWLQKFSPKFEEIFVICLERGEYDLPHNIKIYSLGKESGKSRIKYLFNFFRYCFFSSLDYDVVFVHMNQEYVLLGGIFWKMLGKKIFLWRNHPQGDVLTEIAVWFSNKVFCTSKFAFVSKYKKTEIMPVGIDLDKFKIDNSKSEIEERKNRILFLGRIAPIKKPDLLIEALNIINKRGANFVCDVYGDSLPKDLNYFDSIKAMVKKFNLENKINFHKSVPNYETPEIYNEHEIFVNLTPSGSFDKTILEAIACGCIPVITNESLLGEIDGKMIIKNSNPESVSEKIEYWLKTNDKEKNQASKDLQNFIFKKHGLEVLIEKLSYIFANSL